jgi:hypothetical protein
MLLWAVEELLNQSSFFFETMKWWFYALFRHLSDKKGTVFQTRDNIQFCVYDAFFFEVWL